MIDQADPPRLLQIGDLPDDLRSGLEALKAHDPSGAQLSALAARLGIDAPTRGGSDGGSAAPGSNLGATGGLKILAGAGLIAGAGVLLSVLWPSEAAPPADVVPRSSASSVPSSVVQSKPPVGSRSMAHGSGDSSQRGDAPNAAPTSSSAAEAPSLGANDVRDEARAAPGSEAPRVEPSTVTPKLRNSASSPASEELSHTGPETVSEMSLLREARGYLPVDPSEALAFTERHRAKYPRGALTQEREMLAITALVQLGRKSEAAARAERVRRAYPKSAYLRQLERLLP